MNLAAETDDLQIGGYAAINHLRHECALELELEAFASIPTAAEEY